MILDRFIEMMHQHLAVDGATVDGPAVDVMGIVQPIGSMGNFRGSTRVLYLFPA